MTPSRITAWCRGLIYGGLPSPEGTFRRAVQQQCSGNVRVLDLGCGAEPRFLTRLGGRLRVGVDPIATVAPGAVSVVRANGEALPFANSTFDVVYCHSVLEHVPAPAELFSEVARVLAPGGVFLVLTPNRWDYVSLLASIVPNRWHPPIVKYFTGRAEHDTFPTLYRANPRRALLKFATAAGLDIGSLTRLRQHPHYLQVHWSLYLCGVCIEQALQRPFSPMRPWIFAVFRLPHVVVVATTVSIAI